MSVDPSQLAALRRRAAEMRWHIVSMMGPNKAHHFGGSLSATDVWTALYSTRCVTTPRTLLARPRSFRHEQRPFRPRAVCGAGDSRRVPHRGSRELKRLGNRLQGHPGMHYTPGIEGCTGSLGEGVSYANGIALAGRLQTRFRVYSCWAMGSYRRVKPGRRR